MGAKTYEISCIREARDHPHCGTITLTAKQTLDMLGVARRTFYRWYVRHRLGGDQALKDKAPMPARVWNRIPENIRGKLIILVLERPELSPRELAVTFTDTQGYFVSLVPSWQKARYIGC